MAICTHTYTYPVSHLLARQQTRSLTRLSVVQGVSLHRHASDQRLRRHASDQRFRRHGSVNPPPKRRPRPPLDGAVPPAS
eukprot:3686246-Pyramimonas_sp.AAC.1